MPWARSLGLSVNGAQGGKWHLSDVVFVLSAPTRNTRHLHSRPLGQACHPLCNKFPRTKQLHAINTGDFTVSVGREFRSAPASPLAAPVQVTALMSARDPLS